MSQKKNKLNKRLVINLSKQIGMIEHECFKAIKKARHTNQIYKAQTIYTKRHTGEPMADFKARRKICNKRRRISERQRSQGHT